MELLLRSRPVAPNPWHHLGSFKAQPLQFAFPLAAITSSLFLWDRQHGPSLTHTGTRARTRACRVLGWLNGAGVSNPPLNSDPAAGGRVLSFWQFLQFS